ncbi:hypothetical protein J7E62_29795 [Variovorax paradoxus]|nr:hypothetical protein [Variovorax paradoxus]
MDNTISIIDTATRKVVQTLAVGKKPMSVAFTPDGKFVYVVNEDDNSVQVIKVASLQTVATVPLGGNVFAFGRFIIQGKPHGTIYIETVAPLKSAPAFNAMTAGNEVDLRFSLGGDHGLGVLAAGTPTSEQIVCPSAIAMAHAGSAAQYVDAGPPALRRRSRPLRLRLGDRTVLVAHLPPPRAGADGRHAAGAAHAVQVGFVGPQARCRFRAPPLKARSPEKSPDSARRAPPVHSRPLPLPGAPAPSWRCRRFAMAPQGRGQLVRDQSQ